MYVISGSINISKYWFKPLLKHFCWLLKEKWARGHLSRCSAPSRLTSTFSQEDTEFSFERLDFYFYIQEKVKVSKPFPFSLILKSTNNKCLFVLKGTKHQNASPIMPHLAESVLTQTTDGGLMNARLIQVMIWKGRKNTEQKYRYKYKYKYR